MEPASILTVYAVIKLLGEEAVKTTVSETVKDAYAWVKTKLGIASDSPNAKVREQAQHALQARPGLVKEIGEHLSQSEDETVREAGRRILVHLSPGVALVGTIQDAKGVNVAGHIETVNQTFN